MGGKLINTDADENNAIAGSLAFTASELTIATGSVTPTRSHHTVDTEADAATDDLDTIATGSVSDGAILFLRAANTARTVVVKHDTGNIKLAHGVDYSLDDAERYILLKRVSTEWHEVARSAGGLPPPDFESSGQTVAADTTLDIAHGLGAIPTLWQVFAKCISPDLGYAVGDEVILFSMGTESDTSATAYADDTNITLIQGVQPIRVLDQSTKNAANGDVNDWEWRARAWL